MCGNCRFTTFGNKNEIICMNEDSDSYGKVVSENEVCDEFKPDYTPEDTIEKLGPYI